MKRRYLYFCTALIFCVLFAVPAMADDTSKIYNQLLKKHVVNNAVNYDGFKKDEALLDQYLAHLSATKIQDLTPTEQFAFYINVYNAFTIKLILNHYPGIDSIKEIGGLFSNPWKIEFIPLGEKTVSLDHVEHGILRPKFKDPRVHFAINCASKSCPPLRNESFDAKLLDKQLDEQTRTFLNKDENLYLDGNKIYLSKIFKWFKADFSNDPVEFIKKYADQELKQKLDSMNDRLKIKYLDYDWSLNN